MNMSIFDPRVMGAIIDVTPSVGGFFTENLFKNSKCITGTKVDLDFRKGRRKILPFVSDNAPASIMEKNGFVSSSVETPLLKPSDVTTIQDLKTRGFGENPYSGKTMEDRAIEMLTETAKEFNDYANRTKEWMAAKAITTGKIPVKGEGVNYTIDFNFTNKIALAGDKKWNNDTVNPINDIDTWISQVRLTGGRTPNICVMDRKAYQAFINNKYVKELLDIRNMELALIKPAQLSENVTYGGTLTQYNLSIYIYEEYCINPITKEEEPIIPEGMVILASRNANNIIFYGELVIIDEQTKDFISYVTEKLFRTYTTVNPDKRYLELQTRPLPVPTEVDSWLVATVL